MTVAMMTEIKTAEEAVKLAQEIERLEAVVKAMKETLKKYVEETGQPVETADQIWGKWPVENWKFTPEKLKELCQELAIEGVNPWEYLTLPAESIRKIGWPEEALLRFGDKKTYSRFDKKKKGARK